MHETTWKEKGPITQTKGATDAIKTGRTAMRALAVGAFALGAGAIGAIAVGATNGKSLEPAAAASRNPGKK